MLLDQDGNNIKEPYHIVPLDFIKGIPYKELCLINRRIIMAVINGDVKLHDKAITQLMSEVDISGRILTLKKEGKHDEAEKLIKEQNKSSRDDF